MEGHTREHPYTRSAFPLAACGFGGRRSGPAVSAERGTGRSPTAALPGIRFPAAASPLCPVRHLPGELSNTRIRSLLAGVKAGGDALALQGKAPGGGPTCECREWLSRW